MTLEGETPMNSTSNTKDDLISRADEQIARAYDQIARADEELARVSQQISGIGRDAVHEPSVGSAAQPARRRLARHGLVGLLSAVCIVGIAAFVLQSSHGGGMMIGAQWAPPPLSTPSKTPPFPAHPDSPPVQVTTAEAAPPQAAPLSPTGPQD